MKLEKEKDGFPITALREVNILLSFHHSAIVDVHEVVVGNSLNSVFMVMEYMEHDLKALMDQMTQPFSTAEVRPGVGYGALRGLAKREALCFNTGSATWRRSPCR